MSEILHFNPVYMLTAAGTAVLMGTNAKKLTHHWFETINEGEVGVWFSQGSPMLLSGASLEDIEKTEREDPFSDVRHYKMVEQDQCFVPPRKTLQRVDVADQTSPFYLPIESADDDHRQKILIGAAVTWHVSRLGDCPVRSITRVKHHKADKKDHESDDQTHAVKDEIHPLEATVLGITQAGLGRVLSGRRADELHRLTYLGGSKREQERYQKIRNRIEQATIDQTRQKLIYYGVIMKGIELSPAVRAESQVQAEALRHISNASTAAVVGTKSFVEGVEAELESYGDNVSPLSRTDLPGQRQAAY